MEDDKRLDRLLDYTKFHIGIYLTIFGGIAGLVATAASKQELRETFKSLFPWPLAMIVAALLMALAGFAGGVIASCCTQVETFNELWNVDQGPWSRRWWPGRVWAKIEHLSFWVSLGFLVVPITCSANFELWWKAPVSAPTHSAHAPVASAPGTK